MISLELLQLVSLNHRPHFVLQLPHLLSPSSGFLLKTLTRVLQLLHLMIGISCSVI